MLVKKSNDQVGLSQEREVGKVQKSISITYHINRMKEKEGIISRDAEKAFGKIERLSKQLSASQE